MQHFRADGAVGADKVQGRGHIGVDHTGAFGHTAQAAGFAVQLELYCILFLHCIGGHNSGSCFFVFTIIQFFHQRRYGGNNRLNGQHLADDTGGSHQHLFSRQTHFVCHQLAHFGCFFYAVCVAGVGVFGVGNDGFGLVAACCQVVFGYKYRCTLHFVLGIYRCGVAQHITGHQANIVFMYIVRVWVFYCRLFYATVGAAGFEPFCGTNAAVNLGHTLFSYRQPGDFIQPQGNVHTLNGSAGRALAQVIEPSSE